MFYKPKNFSDLYYTKSGNDIWDFLNKYPNIVRLETASKLSRPAVEGVADNLLDKFGEDVQDDRTKQMIGHMVRQIMERLGYQLYTQNASVRFGGLFSKGSKYIKIQKKNQKNHK